jgi:excisionase family DNA binding protein
VEQLPGPCRLLATRKDEAPGAVDFSSNSEGFKWSGRQDLNLRPLGPEAPRAVVDGVAPGLLASHPVEVTEDTASAGVQPFAPGGTPTTPHGAPVVRNLDDLDSDPDRLLTVSEVAARLAVCCATVYALCDRGELRHIRVSSAIRIHPTDSESFTQAQHSRHRLTPSNSDTSATARHRRSF